MTPKVSCVVVARKGHVWHSAGLAGGREYVVIVRPDGEDEDVEAVASRRLYSSVEPGDRLTLEREWFMASPQVQPLLGARFRSGGVMSLPEDEQRQLQEIEQALYRDDPKFRRRMRAIDPQARYKRKLMAAQLGVVIGVGLLPAGAVTHRVYLLAVGVVIVLLSLAWAVVGRA